MGQKNKPPAKASILGRFKSMKVEDLLWLVVIILVQGDRRSAVWPTYVTLAQFLTAILKQSVRYSSGPVWRPCEDDGRLLKVVAVPCLLQSAAGWNDDLNLLAKCITLCSFPSRTFRFLSLFVTIVLDPTLQPGGCIMFVLIWSVWDLYLSRKHRGILTRGELGVWCAGCAIVSFEWMQKTAVSTSDADVFHSSIALSGVVGCAMTCSLLTAFQLPWRVRLSMHIVMPLAITEASLWWNGYRTTLPSHVSLSLSWLVQFLMAFENGYPRYWGLLYWAVVLLVFWIPTSLVLQNSRLSVVVRRKWFHLLAVVLFGPVTSMMPQLQSLSYAIALCIMAVAEELRRDIPFLQSFYLHFVDPTKDNPALIVSHVFLILGCAIPLWTAEWIYDDISMHHSLSQWGVLCLGIGDASGAVFGTFFGRHHWGQNRRTIEGSLAMLLSIGIGAIALSPRNYVALAVAATVTTLMEAFTLQMDNLVLPIVGSTMILLQS